MIIDNSKTKPAVIYFTPAGKVIAEKIKSLMNCKVIPHDYGRSSENKDADYSSPQGNGSTLQLIRDLFHSGIPLIGICSSGILIRAVAPLIKSKHTDPFVIALSEDGKSVVPLIGGHREGNRIATYVASILECERPSVTTSGDILYSVALDNPDLGWHPPDPLLAKKAIRMLQTTQSGVRFQSDIDNFNGLPFTEHNLPKGEEILINISIKRQKEDNKPKAYSQEVVSNENVKKPYISLNYCPKVLTLGIGCIRGCTADAMDQLIKDTLESYNINPEAIAGAFTVDIKEDEAAIHYIAKKLNIPVRFFSPSFLQQYKEKIPNPSPIVEKEVGCAGVAEAAAIAAAGENGMFLVHKQKNAEATCAIAMDGSGSPVLNIPGKTRGTLFIIGIGPGNKGWMTSEALKCILEAEEFVGYTLYLDLIDDLIGERHRSSFPLGQEQERCRYSLEQAALGKKVALICSGDSSIYAMGSLVTEILDTSCSEGKISDAAKRVEVKYIAGISAFQAASSRMGAIIGHDFCTISLSDLLTPWETIKKRVSMASEGDFVIAIYNPISQKRYKQFAEAISIIRKFRSPNTPVIVARYLGREKEHCNICTLQDIENQDIDMTTTVIVGSSQSKSLLHSGGRIAYTPRGYMNKTNLS